MKNNGKQEVMKYTDNKKTTLTTDEKGLEISTLGYIGARFTPDEVQKVSIALDLLGRSGWNSVPAESRRARAERSSDVQIDELRFGAAWRLEVIEEYEKLQAERKSVLRTSPEALRALKYRNSIGPKDTFTSWDETGFDDDTVSDWIEELRKHESSNPPEWETEEALEALALYNTQALVSALKSWDEVSSDRGIIQWTLEIWLRALRKNKEAERAEQQEQLEKLALRMFNSFTGRDLTSLAELGEGHKRETWLKLAQAAKLTV
jgi:hypothetical protein